MYPFNCFFALYHNFLNTTTIYQKLIRSKYGVTLSTCCIKNSNNLIKNTPQINHKNLESY